MTKTAQHVTRIGMARAKGEHLHAVNEAKQDERVGLMNPAFQYVGAADTDIRKTWLRFGWTPILRRS
jgi:hypothetical protein